MAKDKKAKDLLMRLHRDYKSAHEADQDNRRAAIDDIKFALRPGYQWEEDLTNLRGNRPKYEFNKIRVTGKRIVNDMRANRPQGKVRAVEDGDKPTAEALEGIARNIWHVSDGDTVIDYAGEYQVFGGMGAWRVTVDYASDDAFEQDARVEAISNPFCLYPDPACIDPMKRDARFWVLVNRMSKEEYERTYPKAAAVDFEQDEFLDKSLFSDDDRVVVCEYWYKEPIERNILLLSDGRTVREDELTPEDAALQVVRSRAVKAWDIYMCIASGDAILEGPTKFVGSTFPFVQVYGEWAIVDGKPFWCGITRFAKDAQRAYNVARTALAERTAAAPLMHYLVTPTQIQGFEKYWDEAHKANQPFMVYKPDPMAPGPPIRSSAYDLPIALVQEAQIASDEIKSVTGIFDASLGNKSNEQTGVAIRARQAQGEIATYNYADNMAKGIRRTWEILVDIIPKLYDTERMVRVLGVDGTEKYVKINGPDQSGNMIDITRGKYDVAVTTGPGFSTQREYAAEIYTQFVQANPALMPIAGDLIFKAMDLPYSDKMAERMKVMLPPQIQQMEAEGKPVPPEAMAVMAQAQQALQMADQQSQLVQQAAAEAEQKIAEADKAKAEVAQAVAEFEVKKAQFETQVAETQTKFAQQAMDMQTQQGETDKSNERESLTNDVNKALAEIQQAVAEYMTQATQTLAEIQARSAPQVVVANAPKRRIARGRRVNGELIVEMQEVPDEPAAVQ